MVTYHYKCDYCGKEIHGEYMPEWESASISFYDLKGTQLDNLDVEYNLCSTRCRNLFRKSIIKNTGR